MRDPQDFDPEQIVADVEQRVQERFPEAEPALVHEEAVAAVEHYADAPVKDFVDVIAEREARARVDEALSED